MKYLIVNADDLGICEETNRAIERCHREGIVTSASLMANMPAFAHAVEQTIANNPKLGIGLHLCLSSGRSVRAASELPLLVDQGGVFHRGFVSLYRATAGRHRESILAQIESEFEAQFRRAVDAGVRLDHVDSHRHVHMIPGIYAIAARLAQRYGCRVRNADERLQWTARSVARLPRSLCNGNLVKKLVLSRMDSANDARRQDSSSAERFLGIVHAGLMTIPTLLHYIHQIPDGVTELLSHPGLTAPNVQAGGYSQVDARFLLSPWRAMEMEALLSEQVRHAIDAAKIQLVRFGDTTAACKDENSSELK